MSKKREYDGEYKVQAVKLAKNLGSAKAAAEELQIPVNTLYGWIQKVKTAELDIGCGERSPEEALSIAKENQQLKKRIKALEKENRRLSEMNEFLEDAAAFFAACRQKSGKSSGRNILHAEPMTAKDGKLYVSAIFDCYDLLPVGLAMADHMRAELCCETLKNASLRFPEICGAIVHSDRGSQYTSAAYRAVVQKYGIVQSMNRAGGRCHDNARCESIWARMKEELFYHRGRKTEHYKMEELKFMVWRYFMSYWSNRRICSSIGGLPPAVKRQRFYAAVAVARFAS